MYHLGEIILVAFTFAPPDFLQCNGQVLQVSEHAALFSLMGNTYPGGNGYTTFALPNLTAPTNMMYLVCIDGEFPPRP